jgi:hypothetical protein
MIRHCNGHDVNLLDRPTHHAGPCACGLTFDDVERSTIYPHVFLPTDEDRRRFADWLDTVSVEEITAMDSAAVTSLVSALRHP